MACENEAFLLPAERHHGNKASSGMGIRCSISRKYRVSTPPRDQHTLSECHWTGIPFLSRACDFNRGAGGGEARAGRPRSLHRRQSRAPTLAVEWRRPTSGRDWIARVGRSRGRTNRRAEEQNERKARGWHIMVSAGTVQTSVWRSPEVKVSGDCVGTRCRRGGWQSRLEGWQGAGKHRGGGRGGGTRCFWGT